jgi:hypothetical protein
MNYRLTNQNLYLADRIEVIRISIDLECEVNCNTSGYQFEGNRERERERGDLGWTSKIPCLSFVTVKINGFWRPSGAAEILDFDILGPLKSFVLDTVVVTLAHSR